MYTVTADVFGTYTRQVRTWAEVSDEVHHIAAQFHMAAVVTKNGQRGSFFCMIDNDGEFVGSMHN